MIPARVDAHVYRRRHVAGDALRAGRSPGVMMVRGSAKRCGAWHRAQTSSPVDAQLARMRIVAIGTGYARRDHFALQEGAEFEDLFALLAVRVIERSLEQGRAEGV